MTVGWISTSPVCEEKDRGNSLISKNRHFDSSVIDQDTPSTSAFCLSWDRQSVLTPCFLTGSYTELAKFSF